jgi:hypothetical protein
MRSLARLVGWVGLVIALVFATNQRHCTQWAGPSHSRYVRTRTHTHASERTYAAAAVCAGCQWVHSSADSTRLVTMSAAPSGRLGCASHGAGWVGMCVPWGRLGWAVRPMAMGQAGLGVAPLW